MAFAALIPELLAGGEAAGAGAGLFGGRVAAGGLFGSTEAEAAGNIASMAPSGRRVNGNVSSQQQSIASPVYHPETTAEEIHG
jgi:hypothetical protein